MEEWNIGILEYWNGGILEWWNTGMVEYWENGISAFVNMSGYGRQAEAQSF
jgi:hypothetical protein